MYFIFVYSLLWMWFAIVLFGFILYWKQNKTTDCPSCGEKITNNHNFCGKCGEANPNAGYKKKIRIIGMVLGGLFCIIIALSTILTVTLISNYITTHSAEYCLLNNGTKSGTVYASSYWETDLDNDSKLIMRFYVKYSRDLLDNEVIKANGSLETMSEDQKTSSSKKKITDEEGSYVIEDDDTLIIKMKNKDAVSYKYDQKKSLVDEGYWSVDGDVFILGTVRFKPYKD